MSASEIQARSVQSALLNFATMVLAHAVAFVSNAFLLRHTDEHLLGLNVRVMLLHTTVMFLAREAFRKACISRPADGKWRGIINLVWLGVPLGAAMYLVLAYVWLAVLEPPEAKYVAVYRFGVAAQFLVVMLSLCAEAFFVVGQAYLRVKFRSAVDFLPAIGVPVFSVLMVFVFPGMENVILRAYAVQVCWVVLFVAFFAAHVVYFQRELKRQASELKKSDGAKDEATHIPMESLSDLFPSGLEFDQERLELFQSFFKQGFLKQLLTEGEKYMITWFSLMPLTQQGIYDVIGNLGAIPARLFFSKLEESSHLYFSQTVTREPKARKDKELEPSRNLGILLRYLVLFGLVIMAFGYSFSHALLHLYAGELLSGGIGPSLLRSHCALVTFLAVNGVSECYAFAVMGSEAISRYNYWMAVMTAAFMGSTYVLAKTVGPVGFVLANCTNFAMRIAHNFHVIQRRHQDWGEENPLRGLLPDVSTIVVLILAAVGCQVSEQMIYRPDHFLSIVYHILVGGVIFVASMAFIGFRDPLIKNYVMKKMKRE